MNVKLSMFSQVDGQHKGRALFRATLCVAALLYVFAGHSPATAEETLGTSNGSSASTEAVYGFSAWEIQPDSTLAEMYGLGAQITTPEVNSELAIILWDEARNNERRPVRSVSDDGNGNIQGNQLRMLSR